MFGAKGSVKNRIYQFWLIRMWREKRKKRKEEQLLRRKQLVETQKKVIEEVIGQRNTKKWKLSKAPTVLSRQEGVVVQLFPLGKKPAKVIEIIEEKPKVGIEENLEFNKKLNQIETEVKQIVTDVKRDINIKNTEPENLELKRKKLKQDLYQIEKLQLEYQKITKKQPNLLNVVLVKKKTGNITVKDNVKTLVETEIICKQELVRVEEALKQATKLNETQNPVSKKNHLEAENKKKAQKTDVLKSIVPPSSNKSLSNRVKTGVMVATVAGGTLIAFPALLQRELQNKKVHKSGNQKSNERVNEKQDVRKKSFSEISNSKSEVLKNEKSSLKEEKQNAKENNNKKLKLYHSKFEASKEADIIIKAELERQKNYLKRLNEKIGEVDVSKRVEYRFKGIHHLLEHMLTFALGVFTIPFSKHRIFGTALGLTLIGNGIRGIRNSLKPTKEEQIYIEWKDFTKAIYNEKMALKQLNSMVIDSLSQLKQLKVDIEREFYGKVSFQEYDEMKTKLEVMELKLLEKQKQIEEMENQLEKAEEKNKVKVKQMEEMSHHG